MSNSDSFIDEVNEELQRDRLYTLLRKYGWIAVLLVILVVGGAAFNEWQKAKTQAAARALGDKITTALEIDDPVQQAAALEAISEDGEAEALVAFLAAGASPDATNAAELRQIAENQAYPRIYRDMAALKLAVSGGLSAEERATLLQPLTTAGAPYRVLAEEQLALIDVEKGEIDAAITRLRALLQDDEASQPLRQRAMQLIVALGETPVTQ
ncbi:MAG TPA: hypothetical protein ENK28_10020 [Aliiroseovarius sp.]|nr:hypothetical protein [Aliiroseovarius sp.]